MDRISHRLTAAREFEAKNIEQQPNREGREEKEQFQKERAFAGAVLKWMDALVQLEPIKNLPLPRSKKLGAAFVPAVLFTTLAGCHELDIVDCSPDEEVYLKAATQWIDEHPDEIQQSLNEFWPNANITVDQLTNTLAEARITCGVENPHNRSADDTDVAATARLRTNIITIDVSEEKFQHGLDQYCDGEWTTRESFEGLEKQIRIAETFEEADEIFHDTMDYYYAMSILASTLAHEAAHLALDQVHSDEVREFVRSDEYYNAPDEHIRSLDEVYAWGYAANYAVQTLQSIETTDIGKAWSARYLEHLNES